jgi:xeroderma pigmentosum group C-complementing protein
MAEKLKTHFINLDTDDSDDSDEQDWQDVQQPTFGQFQINNTQNEPLEIDIPLNGEKKRKRKGISRTDRLERIHLHVAHFISLLGSARLRNNWCDDKELQASILSLLPRDLIDLASQISYKEHPDGGTDLFTKNTLLRITSYWNRWLDGVDTHRSKVKSVIGPVDLANIATNTLAVVPKDQKDQVKVLLTVTMLRSLGIHARLIVSIHPISTSMKLKEKTNSEEDERKRVRMDSFLDNLSDADVINLDSDQQQPKTMHCPPCLYFVEVLLPSHDWIHLNVHKNKWEEGEHVLNAISEYTNKLGLKARYGPQGEVIWIVALQFNSLRDVTARYAPRQTSYTQKAATGLLRPLGWFLWWPLLLHRFAKIPRRHRTILTSSWIREDELFRRVVVDTSSKMPTRLEDFRNHPLYVLEKHLRRNEIIFPKEKIIATYRKEHVYPRDNVKQVFSKEHWQKLGRVILEDAVPSKLVKRRQPSTLKGKRAKEFAQLDNERGLNGASGSEEELVDAQGQVALFGEWQTKLYVPPPVVDGFVPKSQYGTVELFVPSMLPAGAVHLRIDGVAKVAKELGIDFAKAVVGFEWKRGTCIPVLDGIVVAREFDLLLREAFVEKSTDDGVKTARRIRARAIENWKRLYRKAIVHSRTKARYLGKAEDYDMAGGF